MDDERTIFSVTELNQLVRDMIDGEPVFSGLYVRGEVSNYKKYPSGHHYFTLKDAESALKCVMFRREGDRLRFRPENGMSVIARGRLAVYQRDGVYQLYCSELIPDGAGALSAAYEQLKKKLQEAGYFDADHKKPLPRYPQKIAVITSSAGAAVRDIIRILGQRYPLAEVLLLPVRVQGDEAPAEIAGAIRYANRHQLADLIITGRGGGSLEDLWAFNDERVAMAIYASDIPVISAVGHEPDVTISDFVADVRASTPSNAAEIAVPDRADLTRTLENLRGRMTAALTGKTAALREKLDNTAGSRVLRDPTAYIQEKRLLLDYVQNQIFSAQDRNLSRQKHRFVELSAKLDALSPIQVLVRGYSMARNERGDVVRSVKQTNVGERLALQFSDGSAMCRVEEITERRNDYE